VGRSVTTRAPGGISDAQLRALEARTKVVDARLSPSLTALVMP
jgi:hypothetical protein